MDKSLVHRRWYPTLAAAAALFAALRLLQGDVGIAAVLGVVAGVLLAAALHERRSAGEAGDGTPDRGGADGPRG